MYRPLSGSAASVNSWLDVQSTIRGLTKDFATAFNTGNYDQAAALFTSDGFLMPPLQTWRRLGIWRMTANCWNSDLPAAR